MLVFVSDLHLRDEEERTVSPRATRGFLTKSLVPLVADAAPASLTVVFLGDIFDINRSPYWVDGRSTKQTPGGAYTYGPWSHWRDALRAVGQTTDPDPRFHGVEFEGHVLRVLENIARANAEGLTYWKALRAGDASIWGATPVPRNGVRYEFIPGNHDRLAQYSRATRRALCDALGLDHDPSAPFPYIQPYREHHVVAFHGHVLSPGNFGAYDVQPTDIRSSPWYHVPAVGDVITVTFGVGLVQAFRDDPAGAQHPELAESLAEIDLVRPQEAALRWLEAWGIAYQGIAGMRDAVDRIAARLIRQTLETDFVQWWMRRHMPWYVRLAARVALALGLLSKVSRILWLFRRLSGDVQTMEAYSDAMLQGVSRGRLGDWIAVHAGECAFIISGHTHKALVRTLTGKAGGNPLEERVYFNSGTWLPVMEEGVRGAIGGGFAQRKQITHVTFYQAGDDEKDTPTRSYWEFWDGSLRDGPAISA